MAVQRFLPDVERTRRGAGWVLIVIGVTLLAGAGWLVLRAGRVNGTGMVFLALPLAVLALGLYLGLRRKEVLEIDLESRTFSVIRNGTKSGSGPLDSLGPLAVKQRIRVTGSSDHRRTVIEYVVSGAVHSKIDLYSMNTPGKARQKMEALARAWRLSCQSYGGAVRGPDALDVPLHERLRGDSEAPAIAPLRPEWGVRIEPLSPGYEMVSTFRSWAPLRGSAMLLVLALLIFGYESPTRLLSTLRHVEWDLMTEVLAGLQGVLALVFLGSLWKGVRNTFFPGTVRIDAEGVRYRRRLMRFAEIEEVTATLPIEVVGDRRILSLAESFCPPAATAAVAHELQRLILDVASRV